MQKIFICYSHKDEKHKNQLERHLNVYKPQLLTWSDRQVGAGEELSERILSQLESSQAAIMLISADFLTSEFIRNEEIPRILKRKHDEGIGVFPFIVEPCDWQAREEIKKLNVRPLDGKPLAEISTKPKREKALFKFAQEVREIILQLAPIQSTTTTTTTIAPDLLQSEAQLKTEAQVSSKPKGKKSNKEKSLIDQFYDFFNGPQKLNYWPLHMIINKPPFQVKGGQHASSYGAYTLTVNNDSLFNFFKSIKVKTDGEVIFSDPTVAQGTKDAAKKVKKVFSKLKENLISKIENQKSREIVEIEDHDTEKCSCVRCLFFRFEFTKALEQLEKPSKDDNSLLTAFTQYQFGDFISAVKSFKALEKDAAYGTVWRFIFQFDLIKLKPFLRNYNWKSSIASALIKDIDKIDLNKAVSRAGQNRVLLDWIRTSSFYSEAYLAIQETTARIRDHFYSLQKGGYSSNSHATELINEYGKLNAFLNRNFVIYDGFSEYGDLIDRFLEGVLAAHAIRKAGQSGLVSFNNYLLNNIALHASADSIAKYLSRYNLKRLDYKSTSIDGRSFITLFLNLMRNFSAADKKLSTDKNENFYFRNRCNQILSNYLVLAGAATLETEEVNKIARALLKFLKGSDLFHPYNLRYVRSFLRKQGKLIEREILKQFLIHAISSEERLFEETVDAVVEQFPNQPNELKLNEDEFKKILTVAFEGKKVVRNAIKSLILIHPLVTSEQSTEIQTRILNQLNAKFDVETFYLAAIFDVIKPEGLLLEKFLDASRVKQDALSVSNLFGKPGKRYNSLNRLINLGFKYGFDFGDDYYRSMLGIDPYYDWLLNLECFDYSKFNPKWITEHFTIHYKNEFRKHEKIKHKLAEYLKENTDPQVERIFIETYNMV